MAKNSATVSVYIGITMLPSALNITL